MGLPGRRGLEVARVAETPLPGVLSGLTAGGADEAGSLKKNTDMKNKQVFEIYIDAVYYNDGQFGSYFRIMATGRHGEGYTFSTPFGCYLGSKGTWVKVQARFPGAGVLTGVMKVITPAQAKAMALSLKQAKKWGYFVQAPAPDSWIEEVREPQPAGELVPEEFTPDQVDALAYQAGLYNTGFETHPNNSQS